MAMFNSYVSLPEGNMFSHFVCKIWSWRISGISAYCGKEKDARTPYEGTSYGWKTIEGENKNRRNMTKT
jgi:hypothetical protein